METANLFENETIIKKLSSTKEDLFLTEKRIRHDYSNLGKKGTSSIFLSEVSYVSVHAKKYLIFLVLGIIFLLFTLYSMYNDNHLQTPSLILYIFVVGFFFLLYFETKKQLIIVGSSGGKISFLTKGINSADLSSFMELVEKTKNDSVIK